MEATLIDTEEHKVVMDPATPGEDTTVVHTKNGYIVISGCPRSGTSLTMKIHRAMYGEDRILGAEFPQEQREQDFNDQIEDDDTPMHQKSLRSYFRDKQEKMRAVEMPAGERKYHDMNPGGFWECAFSVQGIFYRVFMKKELEDVKKDWKIVKVVSQGLLNSDVTFISKVVFLLRHPRAVAKSQERLVRTLGVKGENGEVHNLFEKFVIHTPEMFIQVTIQAMQFLLLNKDIPFLIVTYEDILSKPIETIKEIYDFNGVEGDIEKGIKQVDPKLNRSSKTEDIPHVLWDDANYVYEAMLDFKLLMESGYSDKAYSRLTIALTYIRDPKRDFAKNMNNWMCFRAKTPTNCENCNKCMSDPKIRGNLRRASEATQGRVAEYWKHEPCLYEMGMDPDREVYLTAEESIANNFFSHDEPLDLEKIRQAR